MRKKFASTLRLNVDIPANGTTSTEKGIPRTLAKGKYKRLDGDDESQIGLLKPDMAVLSPWSPSEEYYPSTPPPAFGATPSPISPPPAYIPRTPLRSNFHHRVFDLPIVPTRPSTPLSTTPVAAQESTGRSDVTKSLIEEVEAVIQYTREWAEDPFIVADDEDAKSDSSGDWGSTL